MPPEQNAEDEIELIEIPGRDGHLTINKGRKKSLAKTIDATLMEKEHRSFVKRWLKGEGRLILSTEPDVFFKANIIKPVEYTGFWRGGRNFVVEFICQPWAYLHTGDNLITITTKDTKIYNPEETSKPLIKIYGTGLVDLIINSKIHKFNINEYVEIDSELMESYKGTSLVTFTGDFPELISGENNISWSGTVTKIEVIPRWRR